MAEKNKDKTLEAKLMLNQLEEFNYAVGDPRPLLMKYILRTFSTVETYLPMSKRSGEFKYSSKNLFAHTCVPHPKKENSLARGLAKPKEESLKAFEEVLEKGSKAFFIIPMLLINKDVCKAGIPLNRSRHMMYALYNRRTHELERLDIKKYHIREFRIKPAFKVMKEKLLPIIEKKDDLCMMASEHDVTAGVMHRLGVQSTKYSFPIYLIAYLHERLSNPDENIKQIQKRVNRLSRNQILQYWKSYFDFRTSNVKPLCNDAQIPKLEQMRCLIKNRKNLAKYSVDPPVKECDKNLVYDYLQDKCVKKEKLVDINIALNKVVGRNVKKDSKFVSLGTAKTILASTTYILSQHPDARMVVPKVSHVRGKRDFSFIWAWKKETSKFELAIPEGFWEAWSEGMLSPARFLVVLLSLVSSQDGFHANVLIYDKTNNEMERFDGLGADTSPHYGLDEFDKLLPKIFHERVGVYVPSGMKYFTPIDYCPRKVAVFQSKELDEIGFDDLSGNCAVWRLWYIDARLSNPHLTRKQVVKFAMKKLEEYGSFPRFIKSYQDYITEQIGEKKVRGKPKTGSQPTSNAQ